MRLRHGIYFPPRGMYAVKYYCMKQPKYHWRLKTVCLTDIKDMCELGIRNSSLIMALVGENMPQNGQKMVSEI